MDTTTVLVAAKLVSAAIAALAFTGSALGLGRLFSECASTLGRDYLVRHQKLIWI
jgi:hypothetical protein